MITLHSPLRHPSGFVPVAMSVLALCLVLGHIAIFGVVHEADEGTAAHLWQLLMAGQLPIIAFFAMKYVPQQPKPALLVLALQVGSALTSCAPVFLLKF